jgi:hypothetical protein
LPPPTFSACRPDPNPDAAPHDPVLIVTVDKRAEVVTLKNVGPDPVDRDGWHRGSSTGNHEHPIGGPLHPGEQHGYPGPSGQIWNNRDSDPRVLYNQSSQLVRYWYNERRRDVQRLPCISHARS